MMDRVYLTQIATKFQTSLQNIFREYFQNLFLSYFYQKKQSEKFFFKGGTALRLVFNSPRFSEDLDFATTADFRTFEDLLEEVLLDIEKEGIKTDIIEAKETMGGYLALTTMFLYGDKAEMKIEASTRKKTGVAGERVTVTSELFPSYILQILEKKEIVSEKIGALLSRGKVRDYYDLYFLLRANMAGGVLKGRRDTLLELVRKAKGRDFEKELKIFLPKAHWKIIKELPKAIISELERV